MKCEMLLYEQNNLTA